MTKKQKHQIDALLKGIEEHAREGLHVFLEPSGKVAICQKLEDEHGYVPIDPEEIASHTLQRLIYNCLALTWECDDDVGMARQLEGFTQTLSECLQTVQSFYKKLQKAKAKQEREKAQEERDPENSVRTA